MLSLDRNLINTNISFISALCLMFGCYYCFNIHYPSELASTQVSSKVSKHGLLISQTWDLESGSEVSRPRVRPRLRAGLEPGLSLGLTLGLASGCGLSLGLGSALSLGKAQTVFFIYACQKFGNCTIFIVFERSLFCSPRLHLCY